jgi:hypothetical protein
VRALTPTPGPWRYGVVEDRDFRAVEADEFYIAGSDDECPATVWGGKGYPRGEANARLIAAAPDLLEALKACAAVCAGEVVNKNGLIFALEQARAAITKATGAA